jgi:hypothetical protein
MGITYHLFDIIIPAEYFSAYYTQHISTGLRWKGDSACVRGGVGVCLFSIFFLNNQEMGRHDTTGAGLTEGARSAHKAARDSSSLISYLPFFFSFSCDLYRKGLDTFFLQSYATV